MDELAIVILTLDEEENIEKAIRSVDGQAPVLVIDSGSSDRTVALAEAMGATIVHRRFDDYASQRNFALERLSDHFRWIFFLDADEELTPELWRDIRATISRNDVDGAYVGYSYRALGHELRHGAFAGAKVLRLMRPCFARFERGINERVDDHELRTVDLDHELRHADAKALARWFHKHVAYAQREASAYATRHDARASRGRLSLRTKAMRVAWARQVYDRLPLFVRPVANFARVLVWKQAWRDGVPGLLFAAMQGLWYPMLIDLMIYEQRHRQRISKRPHHA